MSNEVVAKQYALALFEIAKNNNQVDEFVDELRVLRQLFAENAEFGAILSHPKFSITKKKTLIEETLSSASPMILNTFLLLVERQRINIVDEFVQQFIELTNEYKNIADAVVYSVRLLTEEEKAQISQIFSQKVGKSALNIENIVEQSVIGGIKVRIGNRIFDGTISKKLESLQRTLLA